MNTYICMIWPYPGIRYIGNIATSHPNQRVSLFHDKMSLGLLTSRSIGGILMGFLPLTARNLTLLVQAHSRRDSGVSFLLLKSPQTAREGAGQR